MFSKIFKRFVEKSPIPVMVQVLLEKVLNPDKLNILFKRTAVEQYTRELLFSSVFELMNQVVFKTFPSINAAYLENHQQFSVSITSVYNKLNGIEAGTSAALVRETACEMAEITEALGAVRESWLPGYRIKILDGNCIEATEHRLEVLRSTNAGALPGKSLVIYDPKLEMAINVFPCEDGHAQERSLLGAVLPAQLKHQTCWLWTATFVYVILWDYKTSRFFYLPSAPRACLERIESTKVH
jgi:hypothetical protein